MPNYFPIQYTIAVDSTERNPCQGIELGGLRYWISYPELLSKLYQLVALRDREQRAVCRATVSCNCQMQTFSYWLMMVDIDLERRETEHGCRLNFGLLNENIIYALQMFFFCPLVCTIGWYFHSTFNKMRAITVFLTTSINIKFNE